MVCICVKHTVHLDESISMSSNTILSHHVCAFECMNRRENYHVSYVNLHLYFMLHAFDWRPHTFGHRLLECVDNCLIIWVLFDEITKTRTEYA